VTVVQGFLVAHQRHDQSFEMAESHRNSNSLYVYECMYLCTYVRTYVALEKLLLWYLRRVCKCVMCGGSVGPKPLVTLPLSTLYWAEKVYILSPQATLDIGKNESIQPLAAAVDRNTVMPCQYGNKQDYLIAVI